MHETTGYAGGKQHDLTRLGIMIAPLRENTWKEQLRSKFRRRRQTAVFVRLGPSTTIALIRISQGITGEVLLTGKDRHNAGNIQKLMNAYLTPQPIHIFERADRKSRKICYIAGFIFEAVENAVVVVEAIKERHYPAVDTKIQKARVANAS